jgi:hypothetical protein
MSDRSTSYCPNCLAEYRPGFDTCADCGVTLVRGPAPVTEEHAPAATNYREHPSEDRHQVPVVLATLPPLEAQLLAGKLQAEGLVASTDETAPMSSWLGGVLPESRMIRVWVLESELEQARTIAEGALSGDDAI